MTREELRLLVGSYLVEWLTPEAHQQAVDAIMDALDRFERGETNSQANGNQVLA